jgi:2,3-bisphosphoglycerate-independent phosphoglycerate mutase
MTKRKSKITVPVTLIVLDGWGYREDPLHNAIASAKTPVFNALWKKYPHTLLEASGLSVGLPHGQMGNSEIGHTTIGAGKVIDTDLVKIAKAVDSGDFAKNSAFKKLFDHVKKHNSTLHVKGLLSNGGVHAHSDHLHEFLKVAKKAGIKKLAIHVYTDGRDTAPQSAVFFLKELEKVMKDTGIGFIATAMGRFYAMDRDNNWDRITRAEDAIFRAESKTKTDKKPSEYIATLYKKGILDEHLEPIVFLDADAKNRDYKIEKNDGVFFFNFRADRARMISKKVEEKIASLNLCYVTMTDYGGNNSEKKNTENRAWVAFAPSTIETTLAAEISKAGLTQAHIAETEKFPHATYFLNGGKESPHAGESHELVPSRKDVATHDLAPRMRAKEIADKAIEHIRKDTNFIFINFANPDMVGHTANVPAIIEAVEEVDTQLGRVLEVLKEKNGIAFVTADHGNAEVNIDLKTKEKHTAHTTNPVPAIITLQSPAQINIRIKTKLKAEKISLAKGSLADIAPTILKLMNLPQPKAMTGKSLLRCTS